MAARELGLSSLKIPMTSHGLVHGWWNHEVVSNQYTSRFQGGKQKFGICKFLKPHPEGRPNLNPQQVLGGTFAIGSILTFGLQGNFSLFCWDSTVNRNYHVLDIHKKNTKQKGDLNNSLIFQWNLTLWRKSTALNVGPLILPTYQLTVASFLQLSTGFWIPKSFTLLEPP